MSATCNQISEAASGFGQFNLSPTIHRGIASAGFTAPWLIQEQTIPATLEGRDILGLAQTGTGKTAAFALPILERMLASHKPGPRVLILAPTRELATQICEETQLLARYTPIRAITLFGGVPARLQIAGLRDKPEILVACPGRLLDLLGQGVLELGRIETLVLDEADRMFDMGFLPDIRRIIAALPADRQNLLFSATMPAEVRGLANSFLRNPHVVELNHSRPVASVQHLLYPVLGDDFYKQALLEHVLDKDDFVSAIVFTRTKHRARRLADRLQRSGRQAVALQGDMTQSQRVRALNGFRKQQFHVLVATDIVARGIDVEQVSHVVNFDVPGTPDAYTHRIGRTGRAGRTGQAITFVTSDDNQVIHAIERKVGSPIPWQSVDVTAARSAAERNRPKNESGRGGRKGRPRSRNRRTPRAAQR